MATVEDDDEFDWEAAVTEIDVACQNSSETSSSLPRQGSLPPSSSSDNVKIPASSKQSTLDKFISRPQPRPLPDNPAADVGPEECFNVDDKPPCVDIDLEAAKTWIYPVNPPVRDYQFAITKTALFANTLVAIPTGLGKTLIAAVVMYNYFRWFPEGKIVFSAPSRPLVLQQIKACHNIAGIPQEWVIDLTGQTSPSNRPSLWKHKRVFFVTPQVLEKDIQSGACPVNRLVCLVIDEAHRASGNHSYCVAVREIMAASVQIRILALTATPGSKTQAIQGVIDNLCISTLEYRNESNDDLSPYVHNRKVELIEVPLGQGAVEIDKQLLDVIRPYVTRLQSLRLVQCKDYESISSCYLIGSRKKFHQAPPPSLPQSRHGEVESYFAVLISLYDIRKMLLSHGIGLAFEALEQKLHQGYFARMMSKNEDISKAKLLMQQNLKNGAQSPKAAKMLEVLADHFRTKDPKTSRVIIFSHLRESVRHIMIALTKLGDQVKANAFIGQGSGKTLKGQSQKEQQAVLEKFCAGGYNVIVATSIAEEGLDIKEVDLVICFDADVSPLRMTQRMGRTGRKNDGRVVVLACEGLELKGYTRKQANARSIRKHMQNGGTNSFKFHPSPRMISHMLKPEVQFIEPSIVKYIPRGKKLKEENAIETPRIQDKLTPAEMDLISKYFCYSSEKAWRPSLIAFPHFQAIPSKVKKVAHSHKTSMLIDAMQCLQEATFSEHTKIFSEMQGEAALGEKEGFDIAEPGNDSRDSSFLDDAPLDKSQKSASDPSASPISTLETMENNDIEALHVEDSPPHNYLFGSNSQGKVCIRHAPIPASNEAYSECLVTTDTFVSTPKPHSRLLEDLDKSHHNITIRDKSVMGPMTSQIGDVEGHTSTSCRFEYPHDVNETRALRKNGGKNTSDAVEDEKIEIPSDEDDCEDPKLIPSGEDDCEDPMLILSDEDDCEDPMLSPRLTNFIKTGVVPESPIDDHGIWEDKGRSEVGAANIYPTTTSNADIILDSPIQERSENEGLAKAVGDVPGEKVFVSSTHYNMQTPRQKPKSIEQKRDSAAASPVTEEWRTPLGNLTNICSMDWRLSSGDKSENPGHDRKLKRLRKLGDCSNSIKENTKISAADYSKTLSHTGRLRKRRARGNKELSDDVRIFIDEEAEVSTEAEMSADEEDDDQGHNSLEDSFIDDRENPTACTLATSGKIDMMGIYRRSLLSQSPLPRRLFDIGSSSPDSSAHMSRIIETGSSSGKSDNSLQTPQINSLEPPGGRTSPTLENTGNPEIKFNTSDSGNAPVINLEKEFSNAAARQEEPQQLIDAKGDDNGLIDDDAFYATLDFDAVEAQATLLLRQKSQTQSTLQKTETGRDPDTGNISLHAPPPSFDLGF